MAFDFSPTGLLEISHLRYKRVWLGLGVLAILLVVYASVASIPDQLKVFLLKDKLLHAVAYGVLMGWFAQIFRHDLARLLLVAMFVLLGVTMEFVQGMVPSRQFDYLDMIANTSGVLLAWALAYTWFGRALEWFEQRILRTKLEA